ncbi:GH39 family glycosyl hydrolase [Breznakia pachnodae]|uniref:Beta-xylosidase/AraC-like DNA-binding protein n=1 Tax=Breznakia pachnodae TaxID=265178 RepID=A0ABU0E5T3_9FIRM|nr:helix-turn-helix domain-containing protein [Breznakia pachnodae]MDQ0362078.1 beta-xylosidase/AraC-like DNA-binding protein [Breznakia pachnodae]
MYNIFNSFDSKSGFQIISDIKDYRHYDLNIVFFYVVFGSVIVEVDGEPFKLMKDDFILVNYGEKFTLKQNSKELMLCEIEIPLYILRDSLQNNAIRFDCNSVKNAALNHTMIKQTINTLISAIASDNKKNPYKYYELGFKFLDVLVSNYHLEVEEDDYDNRLESILKYIYTNYNVRLSLDDIASHFFMSSSYFSRYFKSETGKNFVDFINHIRLMKAVEDVENTDKNITQIAIDHGFASTTAFNKLFKEEYKVTPSTYRQEYQETHQIEQKDDKTLEVVEKLKEFNYEYVEERINEEITLDVTTSYPQRLQVTKMMNFGPANKLLVSSVQEQVLRTRKSLRIEYIRISDIFSKDIVSIENDEVYLDYDKIQNIFEFLIKNNIQVLIELETPSFEGYELTSLSDEQFEEYIMVFKEVFRKFLAYIINQFMLLNVGKYMFELSNHSGLNSTRYIKLYKAVFMLLKSYSTNFTIGGVGYNNDTDKPNFFRDLEASNVQLDFVSMVSYTIPQLSQLKDLGNNDKLYDDVMLVKERLVDTKYEDLPLYVTSWNYSKQYPDYVNDTCFKGSYVVKSLQSVSDEVDVIAYDGLSDLVIDSKNTNQLLNGSYGLLTRQGLYKPAFYGYKFYHHLKDNIVKKEHSYIATIDDDCNMSILCNNYCQVEPSMYLKKDKIHVNDVNQLFHNESKSMRFHLSGVKNGEYEVRAFTISSECGSLIDEWKKWNYLNFVTSKDIDHLARKASPDLAIKQVSVTNQVLTLDVDLLSNQITTIYCDLIKK